MNKKKEPPSIKSQSLWVVIVSWFWKKLTSADEAADALLEQKKAEAYKIYAEGKKAEAEAKLLEMQALKLALEIAKGAGKEIHALPDALQDEKLELSKLENEQDGK